MNEDLLLVGLARAIHELWRARLVEEGWRPGAYEPEIKVHDALVPFDELSRADQYAIYSYIRSEHLSERLTAHLRYPRGPARPFLLEEMKVGLQVAYCERRCPARLDEVPDADRGQVLEWTVENGELALITVLWGDGRQIQYHPSEWELARVDELG